MDKRGVCWANVEEIDTRFCSERCQQVLDQAWEAQHEEAQLARQTDSNAAALCEAAPLLPELAKRVKEWLARRGRARSVVSHVCTRVRRRSVARARVLEQARAA